MASFSHTFFLSFSVPFGLAPSIQTACIQNGFEFCCQLSNDGIAKTNEASKFFQALTEIQSSYTQQLTKLLQSSKLLLRVKDSESGGLRASWASLFKQLEAVAQQHQDFAQCTVDQIVLPMSAFGKEAEGRRKELVREGEQLSKELEEASHALSRTQRSYASKAREADAAAQAMQRVQSELGSKGSEVISAERKFEKAVEAAQAAQQSYAQQLEKSNDCSTAFYHAKMPSVLSGFQKLEEDRLIMTRVHLRNTGHLLGEFVRNYQLASSSISQSADQINIAADMQALIAAHSTNFRAPSSARFQTAVLLHLDQSFKPLAPSSQATVGDSGRSSVDSAMAATRAAASECLAAEDLHIARSVPDDFVSQTRDTPSSASSVSPSSSPPTSKFAFQKREPAAARMSWARGASHGSTSALRLGGSRESMKLAEGPSLSQQVMAMLAKDNNAAAPAPTTTDSATTSSHVAPSSAPVVELTSDAADSQTTSSSSSSESLSSSPSSKWTTTTRGPRLPRVQSVMLGRGATPLDAPPSPDPLPPTQATAPSPAPPASDQPQISIQMLISDPRNPLAKTAKTYTFDFDPSRSVGDLVQILAQQPDIRRRDYNEIILSTSDGTELDTDCILDSFWTPGHPLSAILV